MKTFINNLSHSISSTINQTISDASNTIQDAFQTKQPLIYTRSDIIALEESERSRRILQAGSSNVAKQNGQKTAYLINNLSFPVRLVHNAGFKRLTRRLEEQERARRMASKPDMVLRKVNGNLVAKKVSAIGWPLIRSNKPGPVYIVIHEQSLLEEQERLARIENPLQTEIAVHNARLVSNVLRWGFTGRPLGSKRYTRLLEEKERARRIHDQDALVLSAEGAYKLSGLIRNMGRPFYVQGVEHVDVDNLEKMEQVRRVADKNEQVRARQHAQIVSRLLPIWAQGKSIARAEQERVRRMSDVDEQQRSMEMAHRLSNIVLGAPIEEERIRRMTPYASGYEKELSKYIANMVHSVEFGEKLERKSRMAPYNAAYEQEMSKYVASMVKAQFSKKSANTLYEKEARRRLRDVNAERISRQNAHKVASLISASDAFVGWDHRVEESERKDRMYDWVQQQQAMKNARKVSNLIKERATFLPEVSVPRTVPSTYLPPIETLQNALPFHSELIEKTPVAPPATALPFAGELLANTHVAPPATLPFKAELLQRAPGQIESFDSSRPLPFSAELLEKRPVAPPATALPFQSELLEKAPLAPAVLPFKSELLQKAPLASQPESFDTSRVLPFEQELLNTATPIAPAPISNIPAASAPVFDYNQQAMPTQDQMPIQQSMPIQQQIPAFQSAAPVNSLPLAPLYTLPTTSSLSSGAPIYSASTVQPTPTMYTQSPLNNSSSAIQSMPPMYTQSAAPMGTYYSGAGVHVLSAQQQKRLERQAMKHNKRAAKENKKAEKQIVKAEKLHAKGKESRAVRLESKAEQHVIASKQHALWANDLISKNANYIPLTTAMPGRPAM